MRSLLEQDGIDVNLQDEDSNTALLAACRDGHTEIVELLLQKVDLNVNVQSVYEVTALIFASQNDHRDIDTISKSCILIK